MFDTLARIQELREARKWSVYRLSKLSGIPQSTIATWYQKNLCPPIDKLEIICDTFGISLSEFFSMGAPTPLTIEQSFILKQWSLLNAKEKNAILGIMEAFLS